MYNKIRNFIIDTSRDIPYLIKSKYSKRVKLRLFLTYLKLCSKYIFLPKISAIQYEKILKFTVSFFDIETLLMQFRDIFIHNMYYFQTTKSSPIIYDCGANIGISVIFFKWLYPKCTIYAFEPDTMSYKLLKQNMHQNRLRNVFLHNIALSNKKERVNLYVDLHMPGNLTMSLLYERLPKDHIIVNAKQLSVFIKNRNVDFIKMDIEGMEEKVLKELIDSHIINNIKEFVIEYHKGIKNQTSSLVSFLNLLETNGYKYRIDSQAIPLYYDQTYQDILIYASK